MKCRYCHAPALCVESASNDTEDFGEVTGRRYRCTAPDCGREFDMLSIAPEFVGAKGATMAILVGGHKTPREVVAHRIR